MSTISSNGGGGGKIKIKKNRMHESRQQPIEHIEPQSYNLDTIPKLGINESGIIDLEG